MPVSPTSDRIVADGDNSFTGIASRQNPLTLANGLMQSGSNIRLDRAVVTQRYGHMKIATGISISSTAVTLPFTLGTPTIHEIYSGGIFAAEIFSSPNYNNLSEYVVLVGPSAIYLWNQSSLVTLNFPTTSNSVSIAETVLATDLVSVVQAFNTLILFRWRSSDAPQAVSSISNSSGTATVTTAAAHGYSTGDMVRIAGSDQAGFNVDAQITKTGASTFTLTIASGTSSNTSTTVTAQRVCSPLTWAGSGTTMARAPHAPNANGPTYSNLIAPWNAITAFFNNQLVIASANDADLVSDILNPFNFDPLQKSFRTNAGSNDYQVALYPYSNSNILALCRKSVWLGNLVIASDGISIDKDKSKLELLTKQIGCCARQSVAESGPYVYFLSDNGVYRLDNSQIDLAIRGNSLPLSDPIQDVISTINWPYAYLASGVCFNNRYYLAVPTGVDTQPRTLLVYNQLLQAWESVDPLNFPIVSLLVITYNSTRRLAAVSPNGNIFLMEQNATGFDDAESSGSKWPVIGTMTTRRYFYGNLGRKRLINVSAGVKIPANGSATITLNSINPDLSSQIASVAAGSQAGDFTIRAKPRRTADYCDVTVTLSGPPSQLRSIQVDASLPLDPYTYGGTDS